MQYHEIIGYKKNCLVRAALESIVYYPFHLHKDDFEIICILNGQVTISDSALTHALSYGDVYIFNPNDPHKIVSEDKSNLILTIQFSRDYWSEQLPQLKDAYFICDTFSEEGTYPTQIKYLRFLLARLYTLYFEKSGSDLALEEVAVDLLQLLLQDFLNYTYERDASGRVNIVRLQNTMHTYKNYDRMYRIVDYVSDHFREKLTLEQIAKMEYLSLSYVSKYIKETLGLTFSELLSLTRCEEAERLLASSKKTIDQIASEVGFANRKHLATQFKRWFSKTPTQYRKGLLEDLQGNASISLQPYDYDFARSLLEMYLDQY